MNSFDQAYYEKYNGTIDEWTLVEAINADPSSGGAAKLIENHYNTFIVSLPDLVDSTQRRVDLGY